MMEDLKNIEQVTATSGWSLQKQCTQGLCRITAGTTANACHISLYDVSGALLWEKTIRYKARLTPSGITEDTFGNILILLLTAEDVLIVKMSAEGAIIFFNQYYTITDITLLYNEKQLLARLTVTCSNTIILAVSDIQTDVSGKVLMITQLLQRIDPGSGMVLLAKKMSSAHHSEDGLYVLRTLAAYDEKTVLCGSTARHGVASVLLLDEHFNCLYKASYNSQTAGDFGFHTTSSITGGICYMTGNITAPSAAITHDQVVGTIKGPFDELPGTPGNFFFSKNAEAVLGTRDKFLQDFLRLTNGQRAYPRNRTGFIAQVCINNPQETIFWTINDAARDWTALPHYIVHETGNVHIIPADTTRHPDAVTVCPGTLAGTGNIILAPVRTVCNISTVMPSASYYSIVKPIDIIAAGW